jgi:hypothetical protein
LQAKSKSLEKVPVPEVEDVEEIDLEKEVEVFCFWCKSSGIRSYCNKCEICDNFIHESCFPKKILSQKYGIPRYCCPTCLDDYLK